jgi:glycerol kinase
MGAAFLAGLASGFWKDQAELRHIWREDRRFSPALGEAERLRRVHDWNRAVERSLGWIQNL